MDLLKIIQELRQERDKINTIIASLEQLARHTPVQEPTPPASRRGRRSMDAAGREEVSLRMKKYWEKRKKGESDPSNA
jgi:hypothetical protein